MKRVKISMLTVGVLFLGTSLCSLALAQGMKGMMADDSMMTDMKMGHGDQEERGKMGKHPMAGMMMKSMMGRSVVATSDGGVVVLIGKKLVKYDKDLNLVKEVDIPVDMEVMRKDMMEMMKNCPMMKEMMGGAQPEGGQIEEEVADEKTGPAGMKK